jgi:hypothetical protein
MADINRLVETCNHMHEWIADHFEEFDDETNMQLLCLNNEIEYALEENGIDCGVIKI